VRIICFTRTNNKIAFTEFVSIFLSFVYSFTHEFGKRYFIIRTGKVNYSQFFNFQKKRMYFIFFLMTDCSLSSLCVKSTFKRNTEERGTWYISSALSERCCDKSMERNSVLVNRVRIFSFIKILHYIRTIFLIFSATGSFTISDEW
jgi:hypothetical protein